MAFSLRAILLLIVLISTAPMFVVIVQTSVSEQNHALERATTSLRNQAQLRANAQEQLFEGARHMLVAIGHNAPLGALDACNAYLRNIVQHFPHYINIGFADAGGNLVCRSTTVLDPAYVGDRQYFQAAVGTGKFTVGEYLFGRLLNVPALAFSLPVYRPARQLHGVLYGVFALDEIQKEFREIPVPPDTTESITDSQGVVLVSAGERMQQPGDRIADATVIKAIQGGQALQGTALDRQGQEWLYAVQFARPDAGSGGLAAVSMISVDSIRAPAIQRLRLQLGLLVLIFALASLVAWRIEDLLLVLPIKRLLARVSAMEQGDWNTQPAARDVIRVRELTQIDSGISQLAAALKAREAQRDRALGQLEEQKNALEESEERYRTQFEASPQPMAVYDSQTLAFLVVNDAAVVHYGYSRDEFMHMTLKDIRPAEDIPLLLNRVQAGRYGPQDGIRSRHIRKNGDLIHVEIAAHDIEWGDRPARAVIVYDVTSRVLAAEAWQDLHQTLEEQVAQRTRELELAKQELETFSYSVSHDLRAPVSLIDGFCAALLELERDTLPAKAVQYLDHIRATTAGMNLLISDLLTLASSSQHPLVPRQVDLAGIIDGVVATLSQRFPDRQVAVTLEQPLTAYCDDRLIAIVFENLIGNAWKFTSRAERASIRVGRATTTSTFKSIVVEDNGVGFDSTHAEKLFKPFQRLHSASEFEGTGIGLAIVYRIIHRHGGTVWAESEPGRGARFYISLPEQRGLRSEA